MQAIKSLALRSASLIASLPALLAAGTALTAVPHTAHAMTTISATICRPTQNNASGIVYYAGGIQNGAASDMLVFCPVVRTVPATNNGLGVWVDGTTAVGTSMSCTLDSRNFNGAILGSVSFTATGTFDRYLSLPASQVPTYSSQTVYCGLPGGYRGTLFDVEPI